MPSNSNLKIPIFDLNSEASKPMQTAESHAHTAECSQDHMEDHILALLDFMESQADMPMELLPVFFTSFAQIIDKTSRSTNGVMPGSAINSRCFRKIAAMLDNHLAKSGNLPGEEAIQRFLESIEITLESAINLTANPPEVTEKFFACMAKTMQGAPAVTETRARKIETFYLRLADIARTNLRRKDS